MIGQWRVRSFPSIVPQPCSLFHPSFPLIFIPLSSLSRYTKSVGALFSSRIRQMAASKLFCYFPLRLLVPHLTSNFTYVVFSRPQSGRRHYMPAHQRERSIPECSPRAGDTLCWSLLL